jgi:hypothetical protein
MLKEHSQVILKKPLPALGLQAGDVGIVVNVYDNGAAYEVEFLSTDGHTIGLATIDAADLRPATGSAVVHARERLRVSERTTRTEGLLERLERFDQEKHGGEFPPRTDGAA